MPESVVKLFDSSVEHFDRRPAMQYFCPQKDAWVVENWREVAAKVNRLANAIMGLGLKSKDRIALLCMSRPEWVISDIAILKASSIVVPIYHSSLSDQIAFILSDAQVPVAFVENEEQLIKVRIAQKTVGKLKRVIIYDAISDELKDNEIYLKDFVSGQSETFKNIDLKPEDVATIVYTSGTTGEPKGAMITHGNLLYEAKIIDELQVLSSEDVQLLFLPLAHIFARVLELSWVRTGHLLAFAQSIEKIVDNMAVVKPTFMAGVPRIFEKIVSKVVETALSGNKFKAFIARRAFDEAERLSFMPGSEGIKTRIAKKLVFDKIGKSLKEKFGGRIRFFVSGGAALSTEVFTFFKLSGIKVCEGYGLTETTAATCLNLPNALKAGTVGRAMPGTEVKLAIDDEIIVKGPGIFKGFWGKEENTNEVIDNEGWFHTGDIGEIDDEGFVKIVDRKRDIIVTSQGKNISPQRVENAIKSKSPIISHVVVVGDKRPYLTALIALDRVEANNLAIKNGIEAGGSVLELSASEVIFQEVKNAISRANDSLAKFEQIKRFHILDKEFEVGKQLTPTLKVRRKACVSEFNKEIKMLYS